MSIYSPVERRFLTAVSRLAYSNPFLPERIENERAALGRDFVAGELVWSASVDDPDAEPPNVLRIQTRLEPILEAVRARLLKTPGVPPEDLAIYEDCVQYALYNRNHADLVGTTRRAPFYRRFLADWEHFFDIPEARFETSGQPAHMFACFWQVVRAFHQVFDHIIGGSMPAARLRANVWQSIFTRDIRRYRRSLFSRMPDFPTLITGPSGTGKEVVARAIAGSRYVPFDAVRLEFADGGQFFPINLAALSTTLIESELFGHKRGAFTGAVSDRKGWLESCPPLGSVFLDELGEMDLSIQVKLLRVIETRKFAAVGDTALRDFHGKLIAATNRDLMNEIRTGRFREDLYYRLCADLIRTPSLKEQIDDAPEDFRDLLLYMLRRSVGEEAERCLPETEQWIAANLPRDYAWPGNYRELEQCVRNIVIRGSYSPLSARAAEGSSTLDRVQAGALSAAELMEWYARLVYARTGSYEGAARQLGLDRRTVKAYVG